MRTVRRFLIRLTTSATRRRDEERLREELEDHLALQTDENVRTGMPAIEARRQAVLKIGAVEAYVRAAIGELIPRLLDNRDPLVS